MLKNFVKTIEEATERNKTVILPDENVIPSNIGIGVGKLKHINFKKESNVVKYNRICATVKPMPVCDGKYKFDYVAPHRTSDRGAYYEMEYKNSIPKGYIRLVFCLKPSDSLADCNTYGVSKETWEANNSKYVTILSFKVKEGEEETQQNIMEEVGDYVTKRMYKQAIVTVINIPTETEINNEEEENEQ